MPQTYGKEQRNTLLFQCAVDVFPPCARLANEVAVILCSTRPSCENKGYLPAVTRKYPLTVNLENFVHSRYVNANASFWILQHILLIQNRARLVASRAKALPQRNDLQGWLPHCMERSGFCICARHLQPRPPLLCFPGE